MAWSAYGWPANRAVPSVNNPNTKPSDQRYCVTTALVIGAGIAGPVAALALRRAGIETEIFESHDDVADNVGSWLTIAVNGLDALAAIDAHHVVTSTGFTTSHNELMSHRGAPLRRFDIGGSLADGTKSQTVKRAALYRALIAAARHNGVAVHFSKKLAAAESNDDKTATARFTDGTSRTADLIIGCDGLRSVVRSTIDPVAPPPRYVGMVNYGGYAPAESYPAALRTPVGTWQMRYSKNAFFGHVTDPTGGSVWFVNEPRDEVTPSERENTTAELWRKKLIDLFAGEPGPAAALIAAGQLDIAADNVYDHPSTPHWHNGVNMLVIGDAAHAPSSISGQGAGMAIEDAVTIAQCLRDITDIGEAFAAYESIRRTRVERMVNQETRGISNKLPGRVAYGSIPRLWRGADSGEVTLFDRFESRTREAALKTIYRWFITQQTTRWAYEHHIDWNIRMHSTRSASLARL